MIKSKSGFKAPLTRAVYAQQLSDVAEDPGGRPVNALEARGVYLQFVPSHRPVRTIRAVNRSQEKK